MAFKVCLITTTLLFSAVTAEIRDQGPHTFETSSPTPLPIATPQQQYETREVILYLTPSQIRALESGQETIEAVPRAQPQLQNHNQPGIELPQFAQKPYENESELQKALEIQHQHNLEVNRAIQNQKVQKRPPPVVESAEEKPQEETQKYFEPIRENLNTFAPQSYSYFNFNDKNKADQDFKIYHPHTKSLMKLVPYEYNNDNNKVSEHEHLQDQLQLNPFEAQNEKIAEPVQIQQNNGRDHDEKLDEELLKLKYAPRFDDQKHAIDVQNLFKKYEALAKAEAIAKSPPYVVHQQVSITKHKPIPVIKHVKVPVPQPYIVRIPEPFEVKVPQPYPVPLEIIRPIPIPIVKTEKIEVEKPFPVEVEKHVPVPVTKKVYVNVDKPYFVQKVVPVEVKKEIPVEVPIIKPHKFTILRHVWEH